jgi:hypothetical protein
MSINTKDIPNILVLQLGIKLLNNLLCTEIYRCNFLTGRLKISG